MSRSDKSGPLWKRPEGHERLHSHPTSPSPSIGSVERGGTFGAEITNDTDRNTHERSIRSSNSSSFRSLVSRVSSGSGDILIKKDHQPKGGHPLVPSGHVPLKDARKQINSEVFRVGRRFLHPLFVKTIMPAEKNETLRGMRDVLIDAVKNLHDMNVAERLAKEANQKREGVQQSDVVRTEDNQSERMRRQENLFAKLRAAHERLVDSHGKNFGAGDHFVGYDELKGNNNFKKFGEEIVGYVAELRGESLDDMIEVLGIVNRACVALKDWSDRYDWNGIKKLQEQLDKYERDLHRKGQGGLGKGGDDKSVIRKEEVQEAKDALTKIYDEATKLKAQRKEQREKEKRLKKFDAEVRLNKAMRDMHALWEARQTGTAGTAGKSKRWHNYRRASRGVRSAVT